MTEVYSAAVRRRPGAPSRPGTVTGGRRRRTTAPLGRDVFGRWLAESVYGEWLVERGCSEWARMRVGSSQSETVHGLLRVLEASQFHMNYL